MAVERLAPDVLITQTNLAGAVTDIQESTATPDANFLTANSNNADSVCVVSFPTPTGPPNTGAGLQDFRIWARVTANGNACNYDVFVRNSSGRIGTAIASGSITSTSGQLITATWDSAVLTDSSGTDVQLEIYIVKVGGSPANRTAGEVGAVEWNADYTVAGVDGNLAVTESFNDTAAFTGTVLVSGNFTATESANDSVAFTGGVVIAGNFTATDTADTAAATGNVLISGQIAVTDTPDSVSASADVDIAQTIKAAILSITGKTVSNADLLRVARLYNDSYGTEWTVGANPHDPIESPALFAGWPGNATPDQLSQFLADKTRAVWKARVYRAKKKQERDNNIPAENAAAQVEAAVM